MKYKSSINNWVKSINSLLMKFTNMLWWIFRSLSK